MENGKNIVLTDEQINDIAEQLDNDIKGTNLEKIAQFPSNNGKDERSKLEIKETGEPRKMQVMVDPNTGEHKITGDVYEEDGETFEEMCERIENSDITLDNSPISEEEINEYLSNTNQESLLGELDKDFKISNESLKILLEIVNRRQNKEDFNVYRAFPQEVKDMIDNYMKKGGLVGNFNEVNRFRNMISENLIDEFVTNIYLNRIQSDFSKEIEDLFSKGSSEIADVAIGYTEERNRSYREYADKMEDLDKKEKVIAILDQIDEAYNLTSLKEFAKKCKVKKFDLEKPERIFEGFLRNYENSAYNIYGIEMARPILYRNINAIEGLENEIADKDINAFFIVFCKQCLNMKKKLQNIHH